MGTSSILNEFDKNEPSLRRAVFAGQEPVIKRFYSNGDTPGQKNPRPNPPRPNS
jgi:hypothetical protein